MSACSIGDRDSGQRQAKTGAGEAIQVTAIPRVTPEIEDAQPING